MPSFLNQQINPPESWQEFEKLCHDLWQRIWDDPNAQRNGRQGQPQNGVDVYGRKKGKGRFIGVQCKGKDGRYGHAVSESELLAEVEKAKRFNPPIEEFILATTAANDSKIQEVARKLTKDHAFEGLFSVEVFGWDEIHSRIANYPDVMDKYFPGQGPAQARIDKKLDKIMEQQIFLEAAQSQISEKVAGKIVQEFRAVGFLPELGEETIDPRDEAINQEINSYRDRIKSTPKTALSLLEDLKSRCWEDASKWLRFRIAANIGAACFELAMLEEAASNFLEAAEFAEPENDKAALNTAVAFLIRKEFGRACEEARRAIELNPNNSEGFGILVAAAAGLPETNRPEDAVPEAQLANGCVAYAIAHAYRQQGKTDVALKWLERAYKTDPNANGFRASYGTELVAGAIDKVGPAAEANLPEEELLSLQKGIALLRDVWSDVKRSELAESFAWAAANLAGALSATGENAEAKQTLSEVFALGLNDPNLYKLAALLELGHGDAQAALQHLSNVEAGQDTEVDLLRAEVLAQTEQFSSALKALDAIKFEGRQKSREVAAKGFRIRLLARVEGEEIALNAAQEIELSHPFEPIVFVSSAKLFTDLGKVDGAKEKILAAANLLSENSTLVERSAVAEAAYDLEMYAEALEIYKKLIRNHSDSPALRHLLVCLYQTKQSESALRLLEKLPNNTRNGKFYRRYATAIYMRSGELNKAISEANAYLEDEPSDLEMRLNWIAMHQSIGNEEQIRTYLSTAGEFSKASIGDLVRLSHLFLYYGFEDRALQLAYQLRREYQGVAKAHLGYIGLMLDNNVPTYAIQAPSVALDTAFTLEDSKGRRKSYIVEDLWSDKRYSEEIPSTHPIAVRAMGKSIGDTITVDTNPLQSEDCKIVQVGSKYAYVLNLTTTQFSTQFPHEKSFWSVDIGAKTGKEFDFAPIFKALDQRQSHVLQIEELYRNGPYPLGFIARLLGVHPLETWHGFIQSDALQIKCCEGTGPERDAATILVKGNTTGFVVDPLTLYWIVSLGVQDALTQTFGRLGITQSALDMYRVLINEHRAFPTENRMAKVGENYVYQEFTSEQQEEYMDGFRNTWNWALSHCDVLPAIGDIPPDWFGISDHINKAFIDIVLAAKQSDRILISDDQHFRTFAKQMLGVDGIWVQVALMELQERKVLTFDDYCRTVSKLIDAGIDFVAIDALSLCRIAEFESWKLSDRFKRMLATLGGKKVELHSSIGVAFAFLKELWQRSTSSNQSAALTGAVLSALTQNHRSKASSVALALIEVGKFFDQSLRRDYLEAVLLWCKEHGVTLQVPREFCYGKYRYQRFKELLLGTTAYVDQ